MDKRTGSERRQVFDRRDGTDRRQGGNRRAGWCEELARRMPDEFLELEGSSRDRTMRLLKTHCRGCNETLRTELAQALVPVLHGLLVFDRGIVTSEHRDFCEDAVARCTARHRQELRH